MYLDIACSHKLFQQKILTVATTFVSYSTVLYFIKVADHNNRPWPQYNNLL